MKSRCSAFNCVIDHFRDNAFGKESDTGEADLHILHPMSATFVRSTNIYLIHKIMQDCRCQFCQLWVFLCSADELLDAVRFFFLLGNLLFPKLHLFRQFRLLLLVISRQLLKAAVIDLARNIVLINPLEQSVKFLDPALCLCELSAFCSQLFFEFFFTLGAEFLTEQVLAIGYVPKKDLQEFQYTLFQYHCTDKVCSTHLCLSSER